MGEAAVPATADAVSHSRERYAGLLAAALEDPSGILPEESARLQLYRERHNLREADHATALQRISSTNSDFEAHVALGAEVETYLHVVAAIVHEASGLHAQTDVLHTKLDMYRRRHGVSDAVHAAALQVLGLPSVGGGTQVESATPYMITYRKMLSSALEEQRRDSSGAGNPVLSHDSRSSGVQAALHKAAVRALGGVESQGMPRGEELAARLRQLESSNAQRTAEIEQVEAALRGSEERLQASLGESPLLAAEVARLEAAVRQAEEGGAQLRAKLDERCARVGAVQGLVDARDAEMAETADVLRQVRLEHADRCAEVAAVEERVATVEALLAQKQRELARLTALPDSHAARGTAALAARRRGDEGAVDAEVDMRALREAARMRERRNGVGAEYVQFHTIAMGIKLSLASSEHPRRQRLRNVRYMRRILPSNCSLCSCLSVQWRRPGLRIRPVPLTFQACARHRCGALDALPPHSSPHGTGSWRRIDALWEEAQRERLPRAEWHAWVRARLVVPEGASGVSDEFAGSLVRATLERSSKMLSAIGRAASDSLHASVARGGGEALDETLHAAPSAWASRTISVRGEATVLD
jgi:hypothetical protein